LDSFAQKRFGATLPSNAPWDQAREGDRARARSGERGKLLDELKIILSAHPKARLAALG